MKRLRALALLFAAAAVLAACQQPSQTTPQPRVATWDASAWDDSTWE